MQIDFNIQTFFDQHLMHNWNVLLQGLWLATMRSMLLIKESKEKKTAPGTDLV